MAKKTENIKVHEHKHEAKGLSQYDIWIDDTCHLDINNVNKHVSFQGATTEKHFKEIEKLIKKYKTF